MILKLYNNKECLIDDEDFDRINNLLFSKNCMWRISPNGYVVGDIRIISKRKRKRVFLHTIIINRPKFYMVDHINRNKLDNRKCNLRVYSCTQNLCNSKRVDNAKGYRFSSKINKWESYISVGNKFVCLGVFETEQEAKEARLNGIKKYRPWIDTRPKEGVLNI